MKRLNKTREDLFWQKLVGCYFEFYEQKFEEKPSFDGSAPRDLKTIAIALKARAESAGVAWTEQVAKIRFTKFLEICYEDPWLKKNFMLFQLNRQKDKIFAELKKLAPKTKPTYQEQVNEALKNFKPQRD